VLACAAILAWHIPHSVVGQAQVAGQAQPPGLKPNTVAGLGDPVAPPVGDPVSQYYTEEQATRGRAQFLRNCGVCHTAAPLITRDMLPPEAGFYRTEHTFIPLGGAFPRKYPTMYHLFRRIRDTMPAGNSAAVSPAAKLDIIAFLLKAGGFPAGKTPLTLDIAAMKRMPLNEQGFDIVFDGRDLSGLGVVLGFMCKPAPLGCGTTNPGTVVRVDAAKGELVYAGQPEGYWHTQKQYRNFDIRFDMLFEKPSDSDPDDTFFDGNGGVLFPVTEHFVYPPTGSRIEVQGHNRNLMAVLGSQGSLLDADTRERVQRPVGQWNAVRVVNVNGTVTTYINGALIGRGTHPYTATGYVIFQLEGVAMRFRNIRIKALPE
jgi:mono/diheme cytochrome c family protein